MDFVKEGLMTIAGIGVMLICNPISLYFIGVWVGKLLF